MPRTKQTFDKRIGRSVPRMTRDMRRIEAESPDSETKAGLKSRLHARQRITIGDSFQRSRDLRKR